jgi:hypothetical protein
MLSFIFFQYTQFNAVDLLMTRVIIVVMIDAQKDRQIIKILRKKARTERVASINLKKLDREEAHQLALKLEKSSLEKLRLARNLRIGSRLNILSVYSVGITKRVNKVEDKTYTYWYASWRVDKKVKNIYLGPTSKLSREDALKKAYKLKARDLNLSLGDG